MKNEEGRRKKKCEQICVHMTKADKEKLEDLAQRFQCSLSSAMLKLLREYGEADQEAC